MGAEEIRPGFCLSCRVQKSWRHGMNASDVSLSVLTGKLSQISCHGGRATKRQMFFCVWQGRQLFCEFPAGV